MGRKIAILYNEIKRGTKYVELDEETSKLSNKQILNLLQQGVIDHSNPNEFVRIKEFEWESAGKVYDNLEDETEMETVDVEDGE